MKISTLTEAINFYEEAERKRLEVSCIDLMLKFLYQIRKEIKEKK